jgi:hypothetical protein
VRSGEPSDGAAQEIAAAGPELSQANVESVGVLTTVDLAAAAAAAAAAEGRWC